jgi:hypothetical protein
VKAPEARGPDNIDDRRPFWDADGEGGTVTVQFALLSGASLGASNFMVF